MFRFVIIIFAFALLGCFVALAQRIEVPSQPEQESQAISIPPTTQTPLAKRQREGTAFQGKHVFFRQTGDRTVLYTVGDNQRYTCLENLTLERILNAALENPDRQFWKIDGEFTEFRGENFILIRRAVIAQDPATVVPTSPLAP